MYSELEMLLGTKQQENSNDWFRLALQRAACGASYVRQKGGSSELQTSLHAV
jgi:hypothetical protein